MNHKSQTAIECLVKRGVTVIVMSDISPYSIIEQKSTDTIWVDKNTPDYVLEVKSRACDQ